jgi:AsmA-like C-terminal region/AsmA family
LAADVEGGSLKFFLSRRGRIFAGIVMVLALFLARPGAQRLRTRLVRSVSLALGRQVDVGSVSLRLLPQPGFELEGFVVHEDPEFGAEPVLQSSDVVALVRVSSLLRGRLEIARLSLTEPSLNLVRNTEGRWNLENLLERAARTPVAPTAKARNEMRPGFPYIEADHGRINFKFGPEKKPYTLTEANFALWQDSENAWGVRLKAQPMRTDFNLSDTGLLEVEGSWQRAAKLHETPLQFTVQWEGGQLGQVTKLTLGQDKGWRGAVGLSASLTGTPEDLMVATEATIQDFRRYDIASNKALRLAATCTGHYSSLDHVVSGLVCRAPVSDGGIAVNGSIGLLSAARSYDLTLLAHKVPLQPMVELARRVKNNVPTDMVAAGKLEAEVTLRRDTTGHPVWDGKGAVVGLSVRSLVNSTRLVLERVPFLVSSGGEVAVNSGASNSGPERGRTGRTQLAVLPRLDLGPFNLALGKPAPASVHGQFSPSGYSLVVQGDAEVQRLLDIARTTGLPAPAVAASGEARINLGIGGSWADFAAPVVTGTAVLNSIHARLRGLRDPVEVASASLTLTPDATEVRKLTLVAAGNTWRGWLTVPRHCNTPRACPIAFDLHAEEIAAAALVTAGPGAGKQPWYRFLSSPPQSSPVQFSPSQLSSDKPGPYLASVHAVGKLSAGRVLIHNLVATRVSADAELEQGRLQLKNLRGEILGGRHTGDWTADFAANPPSVSGNGALEKVTLGQLAEAMNDGWITGTANLEYRANTLGWNKTELLSGAAGTLQVEAHDGSLPHLLLAGEGAPLRITRLIGRLRLHDGKFEIEEGKLQTPSSIYQLSGTASLNRVLDIKLAREGARGFNVTGTLSQPHVVMNPTPETQAALKP